MDLSRRSRLPPLILFIILLCIQMSHSRFFGERSKRQNGAHMYLSASSIIPGGEGDDASEWTDWSSPSECSRSCGGGVSFQTRECLRTSPNGAPVCIGGNRKYFSCNTQDCPEEEADFRDQQCSRFNHQAFDGIFYEWVPYTNAPNPCELNCMPKGERFYYRHKAKVIDGTRCNDQDLDVCVDGQCQPVGCDMMLGSEAKEDSCRECGGDGTTCRTISDKFTTNNLAAGYNDLLLVPSGATNIRVQEIAPSNNYLACRNLSSHYFLNGNWRIDFPRPMFFAGSWWNYQRKPTGFAAPDQLSCRGPITESIYIVMLVQDKNVSIEYEYSIPQSVNSQTPDVYTWTHMEYGPCSASCGGGTQARAVTCNNRLNLEQVDESFCDDNAKPAESQECGTEPCAPHWVSSEWDKCSKGCGSDGIQNRTVTCQRISPTGEHTTEDDAVCLDQVGNKPANQQECNRDIKNCPKYHLGPWSPCDKLCGEGQQKRKVTCYIKENGKKKILNDDECIEAKPETEKMCMLTPCEGVDWILSQWSGCEACGQTTETRSAICASKSGKVYDDKFCAPETPLLTRSCKSKKCTTLWFTSEWSKCSAPCGKGIQSRVVLCGEFDGKTITQVADDSQCNGATKPEAEQECEGEDKECPGQWFTGPWEPCTKPCDGGERQREVLCLANGTKSNYCDESKIESLSEKCNTQACTEDEVLPVESTDKPVTDEEYEDDCEEEDDDDDIKFVTDKMSEDLKISDGIDLDEESTMSSLITDDLMLSDSTPAVETTGEESSTDIPLTTVDGSGDHSDSTDMSSIITEGSGDDMEKTSVLSTSTDEYESTESATESGSSENSDITTDITESFKSTESLTTDSSETTNISETSDFTDTSISTDKSTESAIIDSSESTDSSMSTVLSTESSPSTESSTVDVNESTSTESSSSTDNWESSSTGESDTTVSQDISTTSDVSTVAADASTESSSSTEVSSMTDMPESTDTSTTSSESTESTDSSTSDSTDLTTLTDFTTQSSDTTDISTVSIDSSVSTESFESTIVTSTTENSMSTDYPEITETSTAFPSSTDSSETTTQSDLTSSTSTSSDTSTDFTLFTDASTASDSTDSATTDSTETTDTSESTDKSTDLTASTSSDISTENTSVIETSTSSDTSDTTDLSKDITPETESTDVEQTTDETTEQTLSGETTNVSEETQTELTTSSDITASTTDSSEDSSLSTDELTTVDIWTTEEDFEKSTPNTLEAVIKKESKPKKCKVRKFKDCKNTDFGCCPDGKHIAKGPFDKGCPIAKTCSETKFGCCHDGVSAAHGKNFKGCPKSQCAETLFGCCPDKFTPAEGEDSEGCPEPTTLPPTTTTTLPEDEATPAKSSEADTTDIAETTDASRPEGSVQSCSFSKFGCCPDGKTIARGKNFAGCEDVVDPKDCKNSLFGCCNDGRTSATGADNEGCPTCTSELYGCCPDNETPAHGPLGEGCCLNSPYGCCPDNINSARGPNFEDCDCRYTPYGCCPDKKSAARGPNSEGCGCESSEFGCCPDKLTPAHGHKFEGCACHTLQFGCCPDGITIAQGPHHYGCHCSQTEFKCCPDEKTPAKGPNNEGCTCLEDKYGCCPDGITSASGDKFEGCENVKEPPQLSCKLPKETGSCGNFSIKFFFDTSYGACAKFWYGGCGGNGNRFDSEGECKETCQDFKGKDACLLPKSQGPCTGYITKWYFDADRGRCEEFKYGGCYGTNNRFDSLAECQSLCTVNENIPPCEQPMDQGPCEGNFERWFYDNETDICRPFTYGGCKGNTNNYPTEHACNYHCRQPGVHKDYCSLSKQIGDCGETHARWHYSEADKKCMPFYYTGCGGNKNNFPSLKSCEDHCPKQVVKDICEIPAEVGKCTNYEPMWYYDTKDLLCRQFYYGGCGGNENKFTSEDACMQRCEKKPEPEVEPKAEEVPETVVHSGISVCEDKPDQGECEDFSMWWHFDKERSVCRQFYYGGCGGNGNRFSSQEDCEQRCLSDHSREPEAKPVSAPTQPDDSYDNNVCLLSAVTGDCANYTQVWYFDSSKSRCSMFYYGGCGGNDNRFSSEEECLKRCGAEPGFQTRFEPDSEVDDTRKCFLPKATGNCLGYQVRWHYNSADGVCDQFVYTGCDGNTNNFASEDECENECFPVQETCVLPPLRGNCNESLIRWHFNQETGSCSEFEFTGCGGNRNNFVTEQECMSRCGGGEPPAPTYSVCDQPLEAGECDNSTTAWYYDNENLICVAFTYTGCGGNGNRFQSREQCERQCGEFKGVDVCNEEIAIGPCRQWQTRYYFNKHTRICEAFTYGGCQGTGNRFENRGECESVCIIGQEPTFEHNKDICKQQVDIGRCSGPSVTERRWYYDDARGNCISFIYSGCAGNQNNFRSYESCYNYCSKPDITNEVLPNRCKSYENECSILSCPYGLRRVPVNAECQRCECKNPCADHQCYEDQQCAIEVSPEVAGQFVPVCRFINKPGICPRLSADDGVCGRECYTDADCRTDTKCCSNGCGFVCVRPTTPTIRTTPPSTAAPVVIYPGEVRASLVPKEKPELDVQTPMGGIAVLRCFATGNPAPNVTWSRNNVVVDTNQGRYVLTSSGDLTIVQVRQTDSGSYVCVASNGLGEPVKREIELQVTEPVNLPAYVYGDRNHTQIVTLNRPAVVRCPAGGHPAPMVHWWRNRSRLPLVSQRFELARDYSLTFRSVQLSDLGPYTCEAWNRLSRRPASIKVTLTAIGPARAVTNEDSQYLQYIVEPAKAPSTHRPSFPYRPTRPPAVPPPYVPSIPVSAVIGMDPNNNYTPGSTIAMGCSVQGYPKPNVTWIKDGLPLLSSERVQIFIGEPYRLIINNVNTVDSGSYGCKAANAVSYSISEESVNIESSIPLNPECIDNEHFANCKLIVKGRYCKNKYYARFCCRSCALAGQL